MIKSCAITAFGLWLAISSLAVSHASAVTFTNNTIILSDNTNYDGQDIIVDNCSLLVDEVHSFSSILITNGGTLTHRISPASGGFMNLTVTGRVEVVAGASIDVTGRGYGGGFGPAKGSGTGSPVS